MAIEKEKFFEIINEVSESEGLNENNLLEKVEEGLRKKNEVEHNKFRCDFDKNHQFSIRISSKREDWMLLHLAAACNNLLTVELLLKKKVSVNARVKDGSKDGGPTALHIAASYGHENIIELLLSDNRVDPSLKSKNRTPREMVGNVPNRDTIIKMLEAAEESYRTKPKKKAKDLNIKTEGGGHYHLSQDSHGTMAKTAEKRSSETAEPASVISPYLKQHDATHNDKQTSVTGESSDSTVDEQYPRVNVKSMVKKIESPQKINAICSSKQTSTSLNESSSDDSGICTESEGEEDIDAKNEELKKLEKELAESKSCIAEHETTLEALKKQNQKESESLKQKMQDLESKNAKLKGELDTTKTKTNEVPLEKAQKELAELRNCVAGHETKLKVLEKLNEENESLAQKIQELGNKNTKLKDKLDKTESQYSKAEALLEKTQKKLEESKSCIVGHETKLEEFNKENESLRQEIKNLKDESEKTKTKTNEVSLEKVEKRQFSPKVACASLAAMLVVGAALSIASGLSALLIVAASVVSALIAGGITYTISKPIAPDTELKEVKVQHNGVCKI